MTSRVDCPLQALIWPCPFSRIATVPTTSIQSSVEAAPSPPALHLSLLAQPQTVSVIGWSCLSFFLHVLLSCVIVLLGIPNPES